jgi:hypothetical protein
MSWHFRSDNSGSFSYKDPTAYTVSSQGSLTHMQIFAREVLQNPLDNPLGTDPVVVQFRPVVLVGQQKHEFLNRFGWNEFKPHLQAARDEQVKRQTFANLLPQATELEQTDRPLALLYIEDSGTRGLVGPETNSEAHSHALQFPKPHCFLGLCRNWGDNQKSDASAGGTYGFGKSVLWKNSGISTVLFFSRLATPYEPATGGVPVEFRFFGQTRLPPHWIGAEGYKDETYFGSVPRGGAVPLSFPNESAKQLAGQLGFQSRPAGQAGASILIVHMLDPEEGSPIVDPRAMASQIRDAAERSFWPAITDGRLVVKTVLETPSGPETETASPGVRPDLKDMIAAYVAARKNSPDPKVRLNPFDLTVPQGPQPNEAPAHSKMTVATVVANGGGATDDYRNKVALIRGAGMVVGYIQPARKGLNAKDFYGVVVGGNACPNSQTNGDQKQRRCERLLALAEPVTHDKWTDKSDALKGWYGARARITEILARISKAVTENTCDVVPPEGDAAPELAKLFPLNEGDEAGYERDMSVEVIEGGTRHWTADNAAVRYEFHVRIVIPGRQNFEGDNKPTRWRTECRFGFVGDGRSQKIVGSLPVRLTERLATSGIWVSLKQGLSDVGLLEDDVMDDEQICELRGETDLIDPSLDASRRYALHVGTAKFRNPQLSDQGVNP